MKCLYQFVIESYSKTVTLVFYGQYSDLSTRDILIDIQYIDIKKGSRKYYYIVITITHV